MTLVRLQAVVAVGTPWLIAHALAPAGAWAWLSLVVPVLFSMRYARAPLAWLATASGLVSLMAIVPGWLSGLAAVVVGAVLVLQPPTRSDVRIDPAQHPVLVRVIAASLVVGAVVVATVALVNLRAQDAAFEASQRAAEESWLTLTAEGSAPTPTVVSGGESLVGAPGEVQVEAAAPVQPPFARLRFAPRDDGTQPVTDRALYVGPDVSDRGLAAGPGHYPSTAQPGSAGNVAIAGHRTGWGSPFLELDELTPGDRVWVTDREGVRHTYVVDSSIVVGPDETWVLGPDPLGTGAPTLTLTTCDPPSVNTKRLIVFATLMRSAAPDTVDG